MKRLYILILMLPIVCSIPAGGAAQTQVDSVKATALAMAKTDHQIDSIYSFESRYLDAMRNNFGKLQSHIDSLNKDGIIRQRQIELAAIQRDSIMYALNKVIHSNISLKKENKEQTKTIQFMKNIPNYLMMFMAAFGGTCFGIGVYNWASNKRKHAM